MNDGRVEGWVAIEALEAFTREKERAQRGRNGLKLRHREVDSAA